ncbi:HAD family hydrolase, partial [Patescibacteria group bacterium]|nr:HAD family hydrolase [Patescibacteria group bacterium]
FDKDGTLIELYNYWYHMIELRAQGICSFYNLHPFQHKNNLMFEMGVDVNNQRLRPEGPVGLLPRAIVQGAAEAYLEELNCSDTSQNCFRIFKEVDELSVSRLNSFIKPIDGALGLLNQLKSKGCKIAIATTDKTERAELAMRFLGCDDLIDIIVGADKVERSKPAPDMLELIGGAVKLPSSSSVMVGDAKTDIQMGINAGYKASIAVCSGLTDKAMLSRLTPYVVEEISKIKIQ